MLYDTDVYSNILYSNVLIQLIIVKSLLQHITVVNHSILLHELQQIFTVYLRELDIGPLIRGDIGGALRRIERGTY